MKEFVEIEGETWRKVPGFDSYEVSTLGRVRRRRLNGSFFELEGKVDRTGYRQVGLCGIHGQEWFLVARLIASVFFDPEQLRAPAGRQLTVNHKNRVKTDNRLENLELITMTDNHRHWRRNTLATLTQERTDWQS